MLKPKINNWSLIGFVVVVLGICLLTFYYYTTEVNECTSDPLRYALEKVRDSTNAVSIIGTIYVDGRLYNFGLEDGFDFQNFTLNISD